MAEIPVERKSAFPWWAWLLVGLALLLLIWAIAARDDGETVAVSEAERQRTMPAAPVGTITSLAVFHETANPEELVGRRVQIESAGVLSVTGDKDFWIGETEGRQVLVILDQVMTPAQPGIEGRYDVNPGQTISIVEGEVKRFPGWDEARSRWNLDEKLQKNFENQQVYIEADKLDIKDWREKREPVQTTPQ